MIQLGLNHGFTSLLGVPVTHLPAIPHFQHRNTRKFKRRDLKSDLSNIEFKNSEGNLVLRYNRLKVWDAKGKHVDYKIRAFEIR